MKLIAVSSALILACVLSGCASSTAVEAASTSKSQFDGAVYSGKTVELDKAIPGSEIYRAFQQGATGFVSVGSVRASVEDTASKHCSRKGKVVRPLEETTSTPPHILGNFPRVEWLFQCVDQPQSSGTAPAMGGDKLSQLERLKKLLDSGAISQQEYDNEKAKILGTQ